jgi:hypothetical protein
MSGLALHVFQLNIFIMKKKLTSFSGIPYAGVLVLLLVTLLNGCADEPIDVNLPGGGNSVSASDASADDMMHAGGRRTFHAHLTGDQERPLAVETDGSGQAMFQLSKDGTALHYRVVVNNIENITQAHIHCGGTEVAGPVIAFLFGFVAEGVTVNGVLAEGVITNANVISRPDSQACMGGVANFTQLLQKLRAGEAYINVHTTSFPGGEIRGVIR